MAVGLISGTDDGRFGLTAAGERLGPDAGRLGEMAVLWPEPIREAMAGLAEHVRTGPRVDPAARGGFWDYLGGHPGEAVKFARAMGYATSRQPGILDAAGYAPPQAAQVVDVGGNRGTMLAWPLKALPEAAGVIIDRSEAVVLYGGRERTLEQHRALIGPSGYESSAHPRRPRTSRARLRERIRSGRRREYADPGRREAGRGRVPCVVRVCAGAQKTSTP